MDKRERGHFHLLLRRWSMKAGDLVDLLMAYQNDDKIEFAICETVSGFYIDTTVSISIVKNDAYVPMLRIDVEVGKFKGSL